MPDGDCRQRHVVIEFASYAEAVSCHQSPENQVVARLRQTGADAELVIVEGTG